MSVFMLRFDYDYALSRRLVYREIDYGAGNPQGTLQRIESGEWQDYRPDGKAITSEALNIESLPPGTYRIHCNES
jgi:hypothetical protein